MGRSSGSTPRGNLGPCFTLFLGVILKRAWVEERQGRFRHLDPLRTLLSGQRMCRAPANYAPVPGGLWHDLESMIRTGGQEYEDCTEAGCEARQERIYSVSADTWNLGSCLSLELAPRNLERTVLHLFRPFEREGSLDQE